MKSNLGKIEISFLKFSEGFQEDSIGHVTIIRIIRSKYLKKCLEIEDIRKSWRIYDVINPWISNLGKISK